MININIWDDYWEDGHVPEGKLQSTYAYCEGRENLSLDEQYIYLNFFHDEIKKRNLIPDISSFLNLYDSRNFYPSNSNYITRWEIRFLNISDKIRRNIIKSFNDEILYFDEIKYNIYSES